MISRQRCLTLAAALLAASLSGADKAPSQIRISFRPVDVSGHPSATFEVSGAVLDAALIETLARDREQLARFFRVFTVEKEAGAGNESDANRPALLGTYEVDVEARVLRFRSRFPTEPGVLYCVTIQPRGEAKPLGRSTFSVDAPAPVKPSTRVVRVAPSQDVLPENLLKFYIEFSAPMSRGQAYQNLSLLDEKGKPLDLPFLELGEELWNPQGTRFTLLFDPGRIKRGLKPREELGPVLEAGKSYTLVIDPSWADSTGRPLAAGFRKGFKVSPPDITSPDPKTWTIRAPAAKTREPLFTRFPEPLDRAMLGRVLGVADRMGKPVAGEAKVGDDETSWSFTPDAGWQPGAYTLLIDTALEDRAGNSIARPFEVDVFEKIDRAGQGAEVFRLPFEVRGGQ